MSQPYANPLYGEAHDLGYYTKSPKLVYVLCSTPRCGSTFAASLISQTRTLGSPHEYLSRSNLDLMAARFGTADDASTLRAVVSRRTSANGIFGTKAHADQLRAVDLLAPLGPDFLPTKHILLKRRDLDRQAVSLARAVATHRWIDMDGYSHPPPQTVSIEASGLLRTRRHIDAQNAAWSVYFEDRQVEPLTLWYEDVVRNPQDAVDQVAAFLGAPSGPVDAASAPLRIQSDAETDRLTRLLRS